MPFCPQHTYFGGQAQFEKLVCRIQNVSAPVSQSSHTEVIPTTPLSVYIILVVFVERLCHQPGIPIEGFRHRHRIGHMGNIGIPPVPTTGAVHVGGNGRYIFDDSGLCPCLELEIVGFGMSLVSHLRYYAVFLFGGYQALYFIESTGQRFFGINVFTQRHGQYGDGEMGKVRHANGYRVDLIGHFVEHLAEILILLGFGEQLHVFLRLRCSHIYVAQGHDIT